MTLQLLKDLIRYFGRFWMYSHST